MGAARCHGRTALVFLLACGLYLGTLGHGFHYDDFHSIVHNPHLRSLGNIPAFFRDPALFSANPESAMYRPVLLVSYALNHALGGEGPAGYHLVNALLHGVNAALVFRLSLALGRGAQVALLGAALFALTPLNAEAVNYISSRSEVLMTCFFLLACLAHLRGGPGWSAVSLVAGGLALLTKSVAVVLAPILALCDWQAGGRAALRRRWPAYLAAGCLALVYALFTRRLIDKALLDPVRPLEVQAWTQLKAGVYYLWLAAVPVRLSVEHPFSLSLSPAEGVVLAAAALLGTLAAVMWGSRQGRFAGAWWALLLLPTAGVPLIVLVNEHRLYLAGIGFALALAWALGELAGRWRQVAWGAMGVYTIILAALALQRSQVWTDELSLWRDAAAKGPLLLKPHLRLGDTLAGLGRFAEAEAEYRQAVELRPQHPAARNNLGLLYLRQGRLPEAEAQFRALLQVSPDNIPARLNLAGALLGQGRWSEAQAEYRRSLEFGETGGEAHERLGFIALNFGQDPGQALEYFDQALAWRRSVRTLVGRGVALRALQRPAEAEAAYLEAVRIDSAHADAWFNLGNLYLSQQRPRQAAAAYRRAAQAGTDAGLGRRARELAEQLEK